MLRKKWLFIKVLSMLIALLCVFLTSCDTISVPPLPTLDEISNKLQTSSDSQSTSKTTDTSNTSGTAETTYTAETTDTTETTDTAETTAIYIDESIITTEATETTDCYPTYETTEESIFETSDYMTSVSTDSSSETESYFIPDTAGGNNFSEETLPEDSSSETITFEKGAYCSLNGYNALTSFDDGEDMQTLYNDLKALADKIHTTESLDGYSMKINATDTVDNIIGHVSYPSSISVDELLMIINLFKADNPIYYWIENQIIYSNTEVYLMTSDEYTDGTDRINYNLQLEEIIDAHLSKIANETSKYRIALYFHDAIIKNMDYANDAQGNPSLLLKDHNIVSAFINGRGVCEAYAKAFQLLLNAAKIDNFYVIGTSGSLASGLGHVWNLVQLDDNNWYYCDLTWDDLEDDEDGVQHNNFCVGYETNVSWGDDGYLYEEASFESQHIKNLSTGVGENYLYELPAASKYQYTSNTEDIVRKALTVDDCRYMISGYNEVQLIGIYKPGNIVIPTYITYNGINYTVVSVTDENLLHSDAFNSFSNLRLFYNAYIVSVKFPSTVRYVSESVFYSSFTPSYIYVNANNPYVYYDSTSGIIKKYS